MPVLAETHRKLDGVSQTAGNLLAVLEQLDVGSINPSTITRG